MRRFLTRSLAWCAGVTAVLTLVAAAAKPFEAAPPPRVTTNPAVEPGRVRWHPSFAEAQAVAKKSGKPVLLFHMMGQLDRQFC
jgi:hypothetical protein